MSYLFNYLLPQYAPPAQSVNALGDFSRALGMFASAAPQPNALTPPPANLAPNQYDRSTWQRRPDGTAKGTGFLGVMKRPDGGVSTEISVGLPINGREMDIPTMVPGLTPQEVHWLLTTPVSRVARELPDSIRQKAIANARARMAAGLSPFKQDGEQ